MGRADGRDYAPSRTPALLFTEITALDQRRESGPRTTREARVGLDAPRGGAEGRAQHRTVLSSSYRQANPQGSCYDVHICFGI